MTSIKKFTILCILIGYSLAIFLSIMVSTEWFKTFETKIDFGGNIISLEFYVRITISVILGFIIGLDRALKFKPIGLKTYTLICVGACLITIISIVSVNFFSIKGSTQMDPMRLVAQLLPAVGFVGAGTIFFSNNKVKGLTSAAFVFFACTVGIGIGSGFYGITIFTFLVIMIMINIAAKIEQTYHLNNSDNDQDME